MKRLLINIPYQQSTHLSYFWKGTVQ